MNVQRSYEFLREDYMGQEDDEFDQAVEAITRSITEAEEEYYSHDVIREFRNPANIGRLSDADGASAIRGSCGDTMEIFIKQRDGKISKCTFFTDGCGATIACGSRLTKLIEDRSLEYANTICPEDLIESLGGLPEDHIHCAELAIMALKECISDCMNK